MSSQNSDKRQLSPTLFSSIGDYLPPVEENVEGEELNTQAKQVKCPCTGTSEYLELVNDLMEAINKPEDRVNHPSHYTWLKDLCGIEVIDITRHMDFDLGNAIKYILRNGHKSEEGMSDNDKAIEDLNKAIFYIKDKIKMMGGVVK